SRNTGSRRSAFARSCAARKSFLGVVQAHYSARSSTSPRISLSLWRAPSCASTTASRSERARSRGLHSAQFGPQGGYLIDFYHVCEYLSAAAKAIAPDAAAKEAWMEAQKEALKTGHLEKTLQALARHLEPPQLADDQAPVRTCHRYLSGRKNQLDYRDALARDLPIGSGEIESAHRYIAQKRLKLPGAWWRVERA